MAHTPDVHFNASHTVYRMGAHGPTVVDTSVSVLPFRQICGQTGVVSVSPFSQKLYCAISGENYISPNWQGSHCYDAIFVLNNNDETWYSHEEANNRITLHQLNPPLAQSLFEQNPFLDSLQDIQGHAALRCDGFDHLPVVGALGDIATMQPAYVKLALDKNYRLDNTPCPYLPHAYINTAHGTRGLTTAPIYTAVIAAKILGSPHPLS